MRNEDETEAANLQEIECAEGLKLAKGRSCGHRVDGGKGEQSVHVSFFYKLLIRLARNGWSVLAWIVTLLLDSTRLVKGRVTVVWPTHGMFCSGTCECRRVR